MLTVGRRKRFAGWSDAWSDRCSNRWPAADMFLSVVVYRFICSLQWIDVRSVREIFGLPELDRAARVLNSCGQVTKGAWGMSWRQEALKGVEVCEKPGGVDKRALIPGFLN